MILPQIILPLLLQINRMIIGRFKHEIPLQTFNRIFIEANSVETNHSHCVTGVAVNKRDGPINRGGRSRFWTMRRSSSSSFCTELTNTLSFSLIDAA